MDPFMGSGQTAIAAINTKRRYVGYEINPEYVDLAQKRIESFRRALNRELSVMEEI